MNLQGIIRLDNFIKSTRDSGYKDTASSIAELIDNSLEAGARNIGVDVSESEGQIRVVVSDDGSGMSPAVLRLALQFGGTTRFNSRSGAGRYGMGLPNSSLSRARRVDVYTWRDPSVIWRSYLDVDEIATGRTKSVPPPRRVRPDSLPNRRSSKSGTIVIWSKCDRLGRTIERKIVDRLHQGLGQIYRKQIWQGKSIKINGQRLRPVDPLFLQKGNNLVGANLYGRPLRYDIRVSNANGPEKLSPVIVTFSELPIEEWHLYSNDEKRSYRISKRAGVSVVRAGREIDYGWFFMGNKRKENYDDWWRCEIKFDPDLDEFFGVTHTKQEIHPTQALKAILSPDIERLAHTLNARVRQRYMKVRSSEYNSNARRLAETRDSLLEPLGKSSALIAQASQSRVNLTSPSPRARGLLGHFAYRIEHKALSEPSFFVPLPRSRELVVLLNEEHPFFQRVYNRPGKSLAPEVKKLRSYVELLLFAAARAECTVVTTAEKLRWARSMRETWSKTLAAFLD